MRAYERMAAQDAAFLYFESPTNHMHIGGVLVIEDKGQNVNALRKHIGSRLANAGRLRQRAHEPRRGGGRPVWVDDDGFDIAYHIRPASLPAPGGRAELMQFVGEVMSESLDRTRPLWELWLVDMPGKTKVIIYKAHHAVVDGIASVELASVLLDLSRETAPSPADDWQPAAPPSERELFNDAMAERRAMPAKWAGELLQSIQEPARLRARASELRRGLTHLGANALFPAAHSSLTVETCARRRFATLGVKLADVVAIKERHGATVNDVVMALATGGLRELLMSRGEDVTRLELRAAVPVSTRLVADASSSGNKLAMVFADLPVYESSATTRLDILQAHMRDLKAGDMVEVSGTVMQAADDLPAGILSAIGSGLGLQWVMNLTITNIPGPDFPLYCLGGEVLEIIPYAPLFPRTPLSVSAMSYNGTLKFGIGADWDAMPDLDVLCMGIEKALSELGV